MATFIATPSPAQPINYSKVMIASSVEGDENLSTQLNDSPPAIIDTPVACCTPQIDDSSNEPVAESPAAVESASPEITSAEKRRREEEESERLVWELMRQESMEAYRIQMEYMRQNAHEINSEDLSMIELLMNEQRAAEEAEQAQIDRAQNGEADEADEGEIEEGEAENENSDIDNWDYDRLIELGNTIGDVKTERWRLRARQVVDSLPRKHFCELKATDEVNAPDSSVETESSEHISTQTLKRTRRVLDQSCAVCMEVYEGSDVVCELRCDHYFHEQCAAQWLADKNWCPLCKTKVTESP